MLHHAHNRNVGVHCVFIGFQRGGNHTRAPGSRNQLVFIGVPLIPASNPFMWRLRITEVLVFIVQSLVFSQPRVDGAQHDAGSVWFSFGVHWVSIEFL